MKLDAQPQANDHSTAPTAAPRGSWVYRAAFLVYALGIVATGVVASAVVGLMVEEDSWYWLSFYIGQIANLVAAVLIALAGFTSRTANRRLLAGTLGAVAILVPVIALISVGTRGNIAATVGVILLPMLLFASWAVGRPLRGLSFVAIPIGLVMSLIVGVATWVLAWLLPWVAFQLVTTTLQVAVVVGTVAIALAFDRRSRKR